MLAVSTAEATYYRYVKRLLLQQRDSADMLDIVEPTLMSEAGHCFSFVNSLITASAGDRSIRLWVNRSAAITINAEHVETRRYFYRRLRRLQSYFLYKKLLKRKGRLFVSTAIRTDMLLLDKAAGGTIPPGKVYLYSHWFNPSASKLRSLQKLATRQPNLVILGPTPSIVNVFKEAGFSDARVVPYPITPSKENKQSSSAPFRYLLYAGAARPDKGFKQIVDLVEYLYQKKSQIPVMIQTSAEHFGKCDAATLADIARLKEIPYAYLMLRTEVLSASEYEEMFSGAVAVQLYKATDFTDRISGITLDAFSAGCPVITTADTWIARMVERFDAGLVVSDTSAEDVANMAKAIISKFEAYNANAIKAGQVLQQENNASMLYQVLTEATVNTDEEV